MSRRTCGAAKLLELTSDERIAIESHRRNFDEMRSLGVVVGMTKLLGARVLCVSDSQILLVRHDDPDGGAPYWVLPGGGREPGETFEQTAIRETYEETGIRIVIRHRLTVPSGLTAINALFVADPVEHKGAAPTVDIQQERYLREARWWPVDRSIHWVR